MKANWAKLRSLSRDDWGVLLRCLWLVPAVELSVRWRSPRHWLPAPIESGPPPVLEHPVAGSSSPAADRVPHLLDALYRRLPFSPTCLTRSLVLYRLFRARGIPCELRIGLRKSGSELEGHAWTELDRRPAEADGFEVMLSF